MKTKQIEELVLQSLEHEMGGVKIYTAALACAKNRDLEKEWTKYLAQTRTHVTALQDVCAAMELDPEQETPGREIVRRNGEALVHAIKKAHGAGDPAAAELVACECVALAETKDHLDWQLLAQCGKLLKGSAAETLKKAADRVEDEEDEHLYHTLGWCRELWRKSLGLQAVLPPPEEKRHVKSAVEAARAEQAAHHGR